MPWKETCAMDEKMSFIVARLKGDMTMTELCEQFGISRDTGYGLGRRYEAGGASGWGLRWRAFASLWAAAGAPRGLEC